MEKARIVCPECNPRVEQRLDELKKTVGEWVYSKSLKKMLELFNCNFSQSGNLIQDVRVLNSLVEIWDYRKKQAEGGERWNIGEDKFLRDNQDKIIEFVNELGLWDIGSPLKEPDCILPLGGARKANYDRPFLARKIIDLFSESSREKKIVALTGKRPLNEIELPYVSEYAPSAKTEYEAMCKGIEKVFLSEEISYSEKEYMDKNPNLCGAIRNYETRYKGSELYVLAAPSKDPLRRANSLDTFEFFLKEMDIRSGTHILLVTNCIYVPFQLLKFIPLAIEKNLYVDCVGINPGVSNMANYCQEVKATVNAISSMTELLK